MDEKYNADEKTLGFFNEYLRSIMLMGIQLYFVEFFISFCVWLICNTQEKENNFFRMQVSNIIFSFRFIRYRSIQVHGR